MSNRIQRARGCWLNKKSEACDIGRVERTLLSAAFAGGEARLCQVLAVPLSYSKAPATQAQRFGLLEGIARPRRGAATTG